MILKYNFNNYFHHMPVYALNYKNIHIKNKNKDSKLFSKTEYNVELKSKCVDKLQSFLKFSNF